MDFIIKFKSGNDLYMDRTDYENLIESIKTNNEYYIGKDFYINIKEIDFICNKC